jgi:ribonuclease H2 subunit A
MADQTEDQMEIENDVDEVETDQSAGNTYIPPSITDNKAALLSGQSYTHYSPIPTPESKDTEYVMGVDEAGRGPVLGPMVYSVFYLPQDLEVPLLKEAHEFTDSKLLTPPVRSQLMRVICTPGSDLYTACGWASRFLSARDISAGMFNAYNLNAQAMDATVELVKGVLERGVRVTELFVDTIGQPEAYQRKLARIFPTLKVVVAKKADLLYPVVSASSITAKVGRDAGLEVMAEFVGTHEDSGEGKKEANWGSGYPSDGRCVNWLKQSMDPLFGWGSECRFSWGTAKELLEGKKSDLNVDWAIEDEDGDMKMTSFFLTKGEEVTDDLSGWYGRRVGEEVF